MRWNVAVGSVVLFCFPVLAHAVSFTFSLTPDTPGGLAGTGSFEIATSVTPGTANFFYYGFAYPPSNNTLTQLTFTIGDEAFTAADDTGASEVSFTSGSLAAITYIGDINTAQGPYALLLHDLRFTFGEDVPGALFTTGSITEISSSVIPEPSTFALFGTGLLGALSTSRRRWSATRKP